MIEEAYISRETAKLLKDKEFNEEVICYYDTSSIINRFVYPQACNQGYRSGIYAAPTQQMAMRWIREVYNLHVFSTKVKDGWFYEIIDLNDGTGLYNEGYYEFYEEAVEAAIKYCLENLIKEE